MIKVTKLKGEVFYVNPYEIEFIEETPDTVISLKSGRKVLVTEKAETVIAKMIEFYRRTTVTRYRGMENVSDSDEDPTGWLDDHTTREPEE